MAVLLLVRHGHSTANADAVLAGWSDGVGLTDRGRGEVERLADRLADLEVVRVVSSPLQRCRETAELLLPSLGAVGVDVADDLGECHYGAWTGRRIAELTREPLWRTVQDDPASARFPDSETYAAESLREMSDRMVAAVTRLDAEVEAEHGADAVWVVVSHGDPIKAVVADAMGAGLPGLQRVHVDPASVSVVRRARDRGLVLAVNSSGDGLADRLRALSAAAKRADVPDADSTVGGGTG
ncbi:putative phosphomutase (TIGR03848 family) [Knoellia remsis]|uniref:Putative phosphomutase (TIGR03848 family) n=1 Tax=Knoellia remsis TaxID=407159 RepID=A0A2T0UAC5_9MICO|nr:MSMEG_4193 family putative phosphomutase [Knoellia remsis]PRY54880.1 putative phosphomutase (TIGR03848 family) [Knoellia remsis]